VSAHPLAAILRDAAHGRFPAFDGAVEVMHSPGPPCDALIGFTGHYVLAADVDAREVASRWPTGALRVPFSPAAQVWLAERLGRQPLTHDALLVTLGHGTGAPGWLRRDDGFAHPRIDEASAFRSIESVWTTDDGSMLIVGRGLCDRWEVGYEVAAGARGRGVGRLLVAAARGLVPAGEPLWAQVAPANAASMRSTLAAGFVPVAAEVLFPHVQ
jgi:hypothetical protein